MSLPVDSNVLFYYPKFAFKCKNLQTVTIIFLLASLFAFFHVCLFVCLPTFVVRKDVISLRSDFFTSPVAIKTTLSSIQSCKREKDPHKRGKTWFKFSQ